MIGALAHWVNWAMLIRLATRHPDWSIVLIGAVSYDADVRPASEASNLHLLGARSLTEFAERL